MMGNVPLVCVADADAVSSILLNEGGNWSAALPWTFYFGGLLGEGAPDGLLMLEQDAHREARGLLQPAFGTAAMSSYAEATRTVCEAFIGSWMQQGWVAFKPAVRRMFATVSAQIFMGIDDPRQSERLDRAMIDGWGAVIALRKRSRLSPTWRRAQRGANVLWSLVRPHLASQTAGEHLLGRLALQPDAPGSFDAEARARLFIFTMFGAFDTTASGTASMGYLLARHPEVQERIRRECLALGTEKPSPQQLRSLPHLDRAWKESLRLYPVAGQLARQSLAEVQLAGRTLPAGTLTWSLTGSLARDPRWWTDPLDFDPDRFSPERAEDRGHKATFRPFGAGRHACVGAQLASTEMAVFWHALLTRCRIRLDGEQRMQHTYSPLGMPRGSVRLRVEPLAAPRV